MSGKKCKLIKLCLAIVVSTAMLAVSGCAASKGGEEGGAELKAGDIAPDFSVELLSGETVKLSDYKGKAVFLNFWATWCGPCIGEMPEIQRLQNDMPDNLVVLAVNLGDKKDVVDDFVSSNAYSFKVGINEQRELMALYPTDGIPYTVVVDKKGNISEIILGAGDDVYEAYKKAVDKALA